jgi:hypothetical protein
MIYKRRYVLMFLLGISLGSKLHAQEVEAKLSFLKDSAFVGEVFLMDFVVAHPPEIAISFPDSGPVFKPFEVVKLEPRLTQTAQGISHDTLRLHLRTFYLSPRQYIRLPFFYLIENDTIRQKVSSDTIFIKNQIFSLAPPPPFKSKEDIIPVSTPPDYTQWAIIGFTIFLLGVGLSLTLRKPVKRYFMRRKLKRDWNRTNKKLRNLHLTLDRPDAYLDLLNQYWKTYLDPQHSFALRSLTTSELEKNLSQITEVKPAEQQTLLQIAQVGDQAIYAGQTISKERLKQHQKTVQKILIQVFKNRLKAVSA